MSLNLILGDKNSGKTKYLTDLIVKDRDCLFIVPEQKLFDYEKFILENLGESQSFLINTLSFNKLARNLLKNDKSYNLVRLLDNDTKNLLIEKILLENKDKLSVFQTSVKKPEFSSKISSQITEFKRYLITPEMIDKIEFNDNNLKSKLDDINIIYKEFLNGIKNIYQDNDDLITTCAELIDKENLFAYKNVYIDGFTGFTGEELYVIESLLKNKCNVYITLPYNEDKKDLYKTIDLTVRKLNNIADMLCCEINKTELKKCYFENKEIEFIKDNLFEDNNKVYEGTSKSVKLSAFKNIKSECSSLIKEIYDDIVKGGKPDEMVIVVPSVSRYEKYINLECENVGINTYSNKKISVYDTPVAMFITSIFKLIFTFNKTDVFLNALKSGFFIKNENDKIESFEIFLKICGVNLYTLLNNDIKSIIEIKKGFGFDVRNEEDVIDVYNKTVVPFNELLKNVKTAKTPKDYSMALYNFFDSISLPSLIDSLSKEYEKEGELDKSIQMLQVYNYILESMERCAVVFDDEKISFEKYVDIVVWGLKNKNIASIPIMFDSIMICDGQDYIGSDKKYVYILGANEGEMPLCDFSQGIINEIEREILVDYGISLSMNNEYKSMENRLLLYLTVTSAKEKLYISRLKFDKSGEEYPPCELFYEIKELLNIKENEKESYIVSKKRILNKSIEEILNNQDVSDINYLKYLMNDREYGKVTKDIIDNIGNSIIRNIKIDEKYVENQLGKTLKCSATNMEKYKTCAFSYYVRYVLKGKESKEYIIDSSDTGTFLHNVLYGFIKELEKDNTEFSEIDDIYIEKKVDKLVNNAVKTVGKGVFTEDTRKNFLIRKLKSISKKTINLLKIHFTKGNFKPWGVETTFGDYNSDIEGISITLSDNRKVVLKGIIDRVDKLDNSDGEYIRIVDYKSSNKKVDFYEIFYGINIQLAVYLMTVLNSNRNFKPGGMLYLSLKEPLISIDTPLDAEGVGVKIKKQLVMDGVFLNNPDIISQMDSDLIEKNKSEIINIKVDTKGMLNGKNTLTALEFKKMLDKVFMNLKESAENIFNGEFNINPVSWSDKKSCTYCPYGAICMFDEKNCGYTEIEKRKKEELFKD